MKLKTYDKVAQEFIIDNEDYDLIKPYKWHVYKSCRYVTASIKNKVASIHRLIMNCPRGMHIDHMNGNPLDNRKANLRICRPGQNSLNRRISKNCKSGYKGVVQTSSGTFRASIQYKKKIYSLGSYETERDAAVAYNMGARLLHKEFASVNYLPEQKTYTEAVLAALEAINSHSPNVH